MPESKNNPNYELIRKKQQQSPTKLAGLVGRHSCPTLIFLNRSDKNVRLTEKTTYNNSNL